MAEHNHLFTPEQIDEQIELSSQSNHQQSDSTSGMNLIHALRRIYQREAEKEALFLHRAWQRIAALEEQEHVHNHENMRLIKMRKSKQGYTPGTLTLDHRTTRTRWQRVSMIAAVLFLIILVGTMSIMLYAARSSRSSGIASSFPGSKIGTIVYIYRQQSGGILSLDWSPDGKRIVSTGDTVQEWNATAAGHILTLGSSNTQRHNFFAARWSPDGMRIATASDVVQVWDAITGRLLVTFTSPNTAPSQGAMTLPSSPVGSSYAPNLGYPMRETLRYTADFAPANPILPRSGGGPDVYSLAWSPDGRYIVSTPSFYHGQDHSVLVWNASTGKLIRTYTGHSAPVSSVAWSPNGKYIASGSGGIADKTVQIWDPLTGQKVFTYRDPDLGYHDAYVGVAWSPDSSRVASYDSHGTTQVWDALTGAHHITLRGNGDVHLSSPPIAWSPDGKRIASVGKYVQLWDTATGRLLFTFAGQANSACSEIAGCVRTVAWSPNGKYIASGDEPGYSSTVKVWIAQ